jgi:hypothetical protein
MVRKTFYKKSLLSKIRNLGSNNQFFYKNDANKFDLRKLIDQLSEALAKLNSTRKRNSVREFYGKFYFLMNFMFQLVLIEFLIKY